MTSYKYFTTDRVEGMLSDILDQIEQVNQSFDVVVGIVRGGLVPATYLSHALDAKLLALTVSFRDDRRERDDILAQMDAELQTIVDLVSEGARVLIVDDIIDSGDTMSMVHHALKDRISIGFPGSVHYAALVVNKEQYFLPHFAGLEIRRSTEPAWIVYPWEIRPGAPRPEDRDEMEAS